MAQLHTPTLREVIVLCGPSASGKSTLCKQFPYHYKVSTDQYIEMYATKEGKTYTEVWKYRIKEAESIMWKTAIAYMRDGASIIWDQVNATSKKRRNILKNIPRGYFKKVVSFELPYEELQRRYNKRLKEEPGKEIPWSVVEEMIKSYERPELSEGWDSCEYRRE